MKNKFKMIWTLKTTKKIFLTEIKDPNCWERLRAGGEGDTEDEMFGWHHQLNGHGFGRTLGVGDRQGGLACWGSWGRKESDTTAWPNWQKDLNKWRDTPHSWIGILNSVKIVISTNSTKFLLNPRCRSNLQKLMIIKLMRTCKGPEHSKHT